MVASYNLTDLSAEMVYEREFAVGGEVEARAGLDRVVAVGEPREGGRDGVGEPNGEEEGGVGAVERIEAEGEVAGSGGPAGG